MGMTISRTTCQPNPPAPPAKLARAKPPVVRPPVAAVVAEFPNAGPQLIVRVSFQPRPRNSPLEPGDVVTTGRDPESEPALEAAAPRLAAVSPAAVAPTVTPVVVTGKPTVVGDASGLRVTAETRPARGTP